MRWSKALDKASGSTIGHSSVYIARDCIGIFVDIRRVDGGYAEELPFSACPSGAWLEIDDELA